MQRDDSLVLDMLQGAKQIIMEYTTGLQPDFLKSRPGPSAILYLVYRAQ